MRLIFFRNAWVAILVLCIASVSSAQISDIEILDVVFSSTSIGHGPTTGSALRIAVTVRNNGPNPYDGVTKASPLGNQLQGGGLSITVDIDQPSKPGTSGIAVPVAVVDTFRVIIPVGATRVLDFGATAFVPTAEGFHPATTTVSAGLGNTDNNLSNNVRVGSFEARVQRIVPAIGIWGAVILLLMLTAIVIRNRQRRGFLA